MHGMQMDLKRINAAMRWPAAPQSPRALALSRNRERFAVMDSINVSGKGE